MVRGGGAVRRMVPASGAMARLSGRSRGQGPERTDRARRRFGGARAVDSAVLVPRGVGQLLDRSIEGFLHFFLVCVAVPLVFWIPIDLGSQLILSSNASPFADVAWLLTGIPIKILSVALICCFAGPWMIGGATDARAALSLALSKLLGIAVVTVLANTLLVGSCCLCPPIGLSLFWLVSAAAPIYVLENRGFFESIARSANLVRGWANLGRWLGLIGVGTCIVIPLTGFATALEDPEVVEQLREVLHVDGWLYDVSCSLLRSFVNASVSALFTFMNLAFYVDCRVRKEGLALRGQLDELVERARSGKSAGSLGGGRA